MKPLLYEWKKLFKNKFVLIGLILIYVVNIVYIIAPYVKDQANNAEYYSVYKEYVNEVSGPMDTAFERLNSVKEKATTTQQTVVLNQLEQALFEIGEFNQKVSSMQEKVKENITYFHQIGDAKQLAVQTRLSKTYAHMGITNFQYHKGWDMLFNHQISTVLILMILAVIIPLIWVNENDSGILPVLYSTVNGKKKLEIGKLMFTVLFAAGITLLFSMTDLVLTLGCYGFEGGQSAIYLNQAYQYASMSVTMIGFYLYQLLFKLITVILISVIILIIVRKRSNKIVSVIFTLSFIVIFLFMGEAGLRTWNPISLFYFYQSVNDYQLFHIFGYAFFSYEITLALDLLLLAISFGYVVSFHRRKRI